MVYVEVPWAILIAAKVRLIGLKPWFSNLSVTSIPRRASSSRW